MEKEIKKYVAFNASSSEADAWWTSNTLKEMSNIFYSWCDSTQPTTITKVYEGRYKCGDLDIYDIRKHPKLLEEMKHW